MSVKNKIVQETVETIIDYLYETSHHYMYKYMENSYKSNSKFIRDQEEIVQLVIKEINNRTQ